MMKRHPFGKWLLIVFLGSVALAAILILGAIELSADKADSWERNRVRDHAFQRLEHVRDRLLGAAGPPPRITRAGVQEASSRLHSFAKTVVVADEVYSYVMVVAPSGVVLTHSERSQIQTRLPADILHKLSLGDLEEPRECKLVSWFGEGDIVDYALPVTLDREPLASIHLGVSERKLAERITGHQASIHGLVRWSIMVSGLVLLAAAIASWWLIRHAREVELASAREAHLAEVGQLARGLVHEIRNPLNAMRMQIAVIRSKLKTVDAQRIEVAKMQVEQLDKEILRVQGLATDFLTYGRPADQHASLFKASVLLREVASFLRPELEQHRIGLEIEIGSDVESVFLEMDRGKLRQALLNVALNSEQSMHDGGILTIRLDKTSTHDIRITVRDVGCGIPREKLERVFEAFFSTKDEGNGLGLAIAKQVIEQAGGSVRLESEISEGTTVEILLPIAKLRESSHSDVQRTSEIAEASA